MCQATKPIFTPAIELEPFDEGSVGSHVLEDSRGTIHTCQTKFSEEWAEKKCGGSDFRDFRIKDEARTRGEEGKVWAMDSEITGFMALDFETPQLRVADVYMIDTKKLTIDFNRLKLTAVGQDEGECGCVYTILRQA